VNRGEAVAELVCDAGGELAHAGERFLQSQLLLELVDGREVGEQTDGACPPLAGSERRHRDREMRHTAAIDLDAPVGHGRPGLETPRDERLQFGRFAEELEVVADRSRLRARPSNRWPAG
jgi:hypothetical protein